MKLLENDIAAIKRYKEEGLKIVFTNGCFDLLHLGHIQYLREAKKLGDVLIVGLNSDASVKKLKGNNRPIHNELSRSTMLAALEMVDQVIVFEESTPLTLIEYILPDVLVKGGDWTIDKIIGADLVIENGGSVKSLNFKEGYATTSIIEKIKKL